MLWGAGWNIGSLSGKGWGYINEELRKVID